MAIVQKPLYYLFIVCGSLLVAITLLSLLNSWHWYFKVLNFPRVATLIGLFFCLILSFLLNKDKSVFFLIYLSSLVVAILIQVFIVFPYTSWSNKLVASAKISEVDRASVISFIIVNVLMENRESKGLLKMIEEENPTFVLAMEINERWENDLEILKKKYPFQVIFPTNNTYGMSLYSQLPLSNVKVQFLYNDSVPSFQSHITMPDGKIFQLLTIHPVPPKPSNHPDNIGEKEKELIKAGRLIAGSDFPAIVAGDFNDVGWSCNTHKFEEISNLNDVRRGRGMFSTFSAMSFIFKWPLDYVYVSDDFKVLEIKRLSAFGSDHYPLYVQLSFNP